MAKVDFFAFSQPVETTLRFGICDKESNEDPAYISYDKSKDVWIATVPCNNRKDYSFIAVDKNVKTYAKRG